jgi:hypothetical protein
MPIPNSPNLDLPGMDAGSQNKEWIFNTLRDKVDELLAGGAPGGGTFSGIKAEIRGLDLEYISSSQIRVTSGRCWIEGAGASFEATAATTLTPTLSASTMHHVYAFNNSGALGFEVSTTAPAATSFFSTARSKAGDTSRRYVGSFRTGASSQIFRFVMTEGRVRYLEQTNASPFRALAAGNATARTSVSLAGLVAPTARLVVVRLAEVGGAVVSIGTPDDAGSYIFQVDGGGRVIGEIALDSAQAFTYAVSASSGSLFADVHGYVYAR